MTQLISKTELEQKAESTEKKQAYNVGEIYPQFFSHDKNLKFSDSMPLETALIWLGAYQLDGSLFPKKKCPICGKEEVLIPYMCGGSLLSGCHTIQFYCTNCGERFVTNDDIDYFRKIYQYIIQNRRKLRPSEAFINCSTLGNNSEFTIK